MTYAEATGARLFTPLNDTFTKRHKFYAFKVQVVVDKGLNKHMLGRKGTVRINGTTYNVYGKACDLPNCTYDAYIQEVRTII